MLVERYEQFGDPLYFSQSLRIFTGEYASILAVNMLDFEEKYDKSDKKRLRNRIRILRRIFTDLGLIWGGFGEHFGNIFGAPNESAADS